MYVLQVLCFTVTLFLLVTIHPFQPQLTMAEADFKAALAFVQGKYLSSPNDTVVPYLN